MDDLDQALAEIISLALDSQNYDSETLKRAERVSQKWRELREKEAQGTIVRPYTLKETGEALGISQSHLYRLFEAGELKSFKVGKSRRVLPNEIHRFIKANTGYVRRVDEVESGQNPTRA